MTNDLSVPNPGFEEFQKMPEDLVVVDANFFLPPNRTSLGARNWYTFEEYRSVWLDPLCGLLPSLALHEAVWQELVDPAPQAYIQRLLTSTPPQITLLSDDDLPPAALPIRETVESLIAPYSKYDPNLDNRADRGEIKTLAHMAAAGYTFFASNDGMALRLIEKTDVLGTSLDNLRTIRLYEALYLLVRTGRTSFENAKNLYKYMYRLTKREKELNPTWSEFYTQMDTLYGELSSSFSS